ncbi:MAG: hypothetical protein M0Z28_16740 [Rhodospirillales bacterium]|nr:hypothetical protein [Rhodospirillales bacterium]
MLPTTLSAPAERLTRIIGLLCRATAARIAGGFLAGPVIVLIWRRLRRLGSRFVRFAARIAAGRAPARRSACREGSPGWCGWCRGRPPVPRSCRRC